MRRTAVLLVLFTVSALAAGAAVVTLASRPDLQQAGSRVEQAWAALRPSLDDRYAALGAAEGAARERLGSDRALLREIRQGVSGWDASKRAAGESQVAASNRLEGLAARLRALVDATPRLRSSETVGRALDAVASSDPGSPRRAYNDAVDAYEEVRGGFPRRLVAGALGFDARRSLEVPA